MRTVLAVAFVLVLAACGQPAPESTTTEAAPSTATPAATTAGPSDAENRAAIAALPAPYNEANYEAGRTVFAQCRSCHTIAQGSMNMVGPNLHGVIGRRIGSLPNFNYSPPARAQNFSWDAEHLDQWIANPQAMIPGTRMGFAGVRDATQRRDLIAYIMVESAR